MAITRLSIAAVENFADGHEFGEAGPYVRIHGVAQGRTRSGLTGECGHHRSRQG
jgi:hypothetical protein